MKEHTEALFLRNEPARRETMEGAGQGAAGRKGGGFWTVLKQRCLFVCLVEDQKLTLPKQASRESLYTQENLS